MTALETNGEVVVARSKEGNRELVEKLGALGIEAVGVETISFLEPADWAAVDKILRGIDRYDWVAFTSPRAVNAFLERLSSLGLALDPHRPRIAAVGSKTAGALVKGGLTVDFVPKKYLTSELALGLPTTSGKRVLLLRADIGDRALLIVLGRRGFEVTDAAVYRTRTVAGVADSEQLGRARVVIFASPSEVRGFKSRVAPELFGLVAGKAMAVCIGPVTASEARAAGFRTVEMPSEHTLDALVEKVEEVVALV